MTILRTLVVLTFAIASLASLNVAPSFANGEICSTTADVSWDVDRDSSIVTGVHVEVEGCEDGEFVGIELLTENGDVPDDGPLEGAVSDEIAYFDISGFALHVQPITGIRVYLEVDDTPTPVVAITVDQRFFNPAGNEQVGLRVSTNLVVPFGGEYHVPGAGDRYSDVDCADVNLSLDVADSDIVGWGSGANFTATAAGVHIACYQQSPGASPGPSPGPPGAEEPEVLGVVLEQDDDQEDTSVLGQVLARTGVGTGVLLLAGSGALLLGGLLMRRRSATT